MVVGVVLAVKTRAGRPRGVWRKPGRGSGHGQWHESTRVPFGSSLAAAGVRSFLREPRVRLGYTFHETVEATDELPLLEPPEARVIAKQD